MKRIKRQRYALCIAALATALSVLAGYPLTGVAAPARGTVAQTLPDTPTNCQLDSARGDIHHVVYIQFDNVHFTRDNPNVPSDLEQMPHLLNFLTSNGALLANHHTPLISHTATDILTAFTGVYG